VRLVYLKRNNIREFIHNYLEMTRVITLALNMAWIRIQSWSY